MLKLKWHDDGITGCPNDVMMGWHWWQDDRMTLMTGWRDDWWTGWRNDRMTEWPDDQMTKWLVNGMTGWLDDHMTGWLDDQMTSSPYDHMTIWLNDRKLRRRLTVWYIFSRGGPRPPWPPHPRTPMACQVLAKCLLSACFYENPQHTRTGSKCLFQFLGRLTACLMDTTTTGAVKWNLKYK